MTPKKLPLMNKRMTVQVRQRTDRLAAVDYFIISPQQRIMITTRPWLPEDHLPDPDRTVSLDDIARRTIQCGACCLPWQECDLVLGTLRARRSFSPCHPIVATQKMKATSMQNRGIQRAIRAHSRVPERRRRHGKNPHHSRTCQWTHATRAGITIKGHQENHHDRIQDQ